jgi:hypothetical protein
MNRFKLALTIACAVFMLTGATANAVTKVFQESVMDGTSTYYPWSENGNWTGGDGNAPAAGEEAEIPDGLTATVDSASDICGFVDIQGEGVVTIKADAKLTLDGDGTARTSTIAEDARLYLEGSSSEMAVVDDSHTVSGAGAIVGQHDSALISVAASTTLTSQMDVTGHLEIAGSGSFSNQGKVYANVASGTLKISVSSVDDTDNGGTVSDSNYRWAVNASNAKLLFAVEPDPENGMQGDFYVHAGTVEIGTDPVEGDDIDVCTTGDLLHDGGSITAKIDDSFKCSGTCP